MIESRGEPRKWLWPALLLVSVLIATVVQLRLQGRLWWCACGQSFLWAGDIWSSHNSQHFVDPYSFSHMLHGVVFCVVLAWVAPRLSHGWRFVIAGILEAAWEVAENSTFVIQRYREATSA
ncbi:MAG: DUF2585 family protein, partial [Vicinamibacteria bacterium]|nr:DUF2585 family protein [Vicinamibacteria bacterium]